MPRDPSAYKRMQHRALACFGRLVPRLPERGVRSDGVSSRRGTTIDRTETMYTHCLLLAALIFSAFSPSAHPQRDVPPTSGVTIVERVRSELREMLDTNTGTAEDVSLPERRLTPSLTRVGGLPVPQPTFRRGSACWWLWVLSGVAVCW
jgi:hypothetical protein